jgi:hypothetical protein
MKDMKIIILPNNSIKFAHIQRGLGRCKKRSAPYFKR